MYSTTDSEPSSSDSNGSHLEDFPTIGDLPEFSLEQQAHVFAVLKADYKRKFLYCYRRLGDHIWLVWLEPPLAPGGLRLTLGDWVSCYYHAAELRYLGNPCIAFYAHQFMK